MEDMNGISLAEFRDTKLNELLTRPLPDDEDDIEFDEKTPCRFTLPEAYFLLHIDLSKEKDRADQIVEALSYIDSYYDAQFQRETKYFIEDTIDNLYENIVGWKNELNGIHIHQENLRQSLTGICRNLRKLRVMIHRLVKHYGDWIKYTSHSDLPLILDRIFPLGRRMKATLGQYDKALNGASKTFESTFRPSELSDLRKWLKAKVLKAYDLDGKRFEKIRNDCEIIYQIYEKIFYGTQKLYEMDFTVENELPLDNSNHKAFEITYNLLVSFEFGLSECYNPEATLLFIYNQYERDDFAKSLNLVITKNEKFYDGLYQSMCKANSGVHAFFEVTVNYEKIAESQGFHLRQHLDSKYIPTYQISLTEFRRLILMYEIMFPQSPLFLCCSVRHCFSNWRNIIPQSKLLAFYYDQRQAILSDFLIKTGLEQKDLAKILGVKPSTISKKIKSGKLFSDPEYSWFWLAATGAMYDYFTGTVTTDAYGRDAYKKDSYGKNDMHYKTIVMEMMATGGAMLRAINDVASFRQKLSRNEFPYRRDGHPLRRTANREVTALVYEIAEILDDIQTKVKAQSFFLWDE